MGDKSEDWRGDASENWHLTSSANVFRLELMLAKLVTIKVEKIDHQETGRRCRVLREEAGLSLRKWNCVYLGLVIRYLHRRKQPIIELIMMELFQIVFFALTIAITVQAFNFI